jgi:hypothetical protein
MLFPCAYLPPAWYVKMLADDQHPMLDAHEHFTKQTLRNRCHILSPNGVQALVVPVVQKHRDKTPVKDIRIANDNPWQRQHWRSLQAAYQRSAYFEFYQDDLIYFYEKRFGFLFDLNTELMHHILKMLHIRKEITHSENFVHSPLGDPTWIFFNRGQPVVSGNEKKFPQVFGYKYGFVAGLSIVDHLFNLGPATPDHL